MDPGTVEIADALSRLTGMGVLVVVFIMLIRGVLMLGSRHEEFKEEVEERLDEMREDRDWWRSTAIRALNIGEAAMGRKRDGP